jgi:hypothetical protein
MFQTRCSRGYMPSSSFFEFICFLSGGLLSFLMICCGRCEPHCITALASELSLLTLFFRGCEFRCIESMEL